MSLYCHIDDDGGDADIGGADEDLFGCEYMLGAQFVTIKCRIREHLAVSLFDFVTLNSNFVMKNSPFENEPLFISSVQK